MPHFASKQLLVSLVQGHPPVIYTITSIMYYSLIIDNWLITALFVDHFNSGIVNQTNTLLFVPLPNSLLLLFIWHTSQRIHHFSYDYLHTSQRIRHFSYDYLHTSQRIHHFSYDYLHTSQRIRHFSYDYLHTSQHVCHWYTLTLFPWTSSPLHSELNYFIFVM